MGTFHKILYAYDEPVVNGKKKITAHIMEGYNRRSVADYKKMAEMLRQRFPQAQDDQIICTDVRASCWCNSYTLIIWTGWIPISEFHEDDEYSTADRKDVDYSWSTPFGSFETFSGKNIIMFKPDEDEDESGWPGQNDIERAEIHLVRRNLFSLADIDSMATELRQTFPDAKDSEMICSIIVSHTEYKTWISKIKFDAKISKTAEYPGWTVIPDGYMSYEDAMRIFFGK